MLDTGNAQFEEAMTNTGPAVGAAPLSPQLQLMLGGLEFQAKMTEVMVKQTVNFWVGFYTGAFLPRR